MNFARVPRSVSISIDTERNRRNGAISSATFALRAKNKKETPKETEVPFGSLGLRHGSALCPSGDGSAEKSGNQDGKAVIVA